MSHLEFSIHCKPENQETHDILIAYLSDIGFDGFQENEGAVQAFVAKEGFSWDTFSETRDLLKACGIEIIYKYLETDDQNWNEEWEKNFVPVKIDEKVLIRAPFHSSDSDPPCTIVIEPKMSFGTGHHQTTRLMIKAMMQIDLSGKSILDMGSGTGILGIYASMNGAGNVVGVDIDNWAFENAKENIERNGIHNMEMRLGDVSELSNEIFDVVVANINRNVLVRDIPAYVRHLEPGGDMILSGFLTEDVQYILDTAYANKLVHNTTTEDEGWLILSFIKNAS